MGSWKRRLGGLLNVWANGAVPRFGRRREHWWIGAEACEPRLLLAGTPTQVVFTMQPSNVAAGTVMQPVIVTFEDAQGASVTTGTEANATVVLTISAGPTGAEINGGRSVTISASGGRATFSNLTFNQQGMYTLTASAAGLPQGGLSSQFSVGPAAAKLVFIQGPASTISGDAFSSIVVGVEDANGNLVDSDASNVTLSVTGGAGTLTGTNTSVSTKNSNGEADFNGLILTKAGTYTLTASDGSLATATSAQFVISPGASYKLAYLQQPTNTPQNGLISPAVTVEVEDQNGNVVTTDSSQVSLTFGPGQSGVLNGTAVENAVNGVATFNDLSIANLGNFTLQASDGSINPATSTAFAVTGPPFKLAFQQQPSQTMINSSLSPITVLVEDAGGNVVATDGSAVTLLVADNGPGGTMSGTTTVNAVNGRATFTDISFNTVGTYTISASDGTLIAAVSDPVLINGPAAKLAFTIQPQDGAAQEPLSPAVVVTVEDAEGNPVINSSLPITLSLNNASGAVLTGTVTMAASNGVATFNNLEVSNPGTVSLSASGGGLVGASSDAFVVNKAASLLVVESGPKDSAATAILAPIVIDVQNDSFQTVASNASTVTLTFTGPNNASVSGSTSVTAVHGVATFSDLSFSVSGTYTLSFQDAGLTTVTTAPITITSAANKLAFSTQPSLSTASDSGINTVTVSVVDQHGRVVTTDHSTITLTASSPGSSGTLTGATSVVAVNGVATFDNLVLTGAGTYTLSATDGSLAAATSKKFSVVPDAGEAQLVFTQTPAAGALVKSRLSPAITVAVEDEFGNIITTDRSRITLAASDTSGFKTTTVAVHKGLARFNNEQFTKAQTYIVTATDSLNSEETASYVQVINPRTTVVSSFKAPLTLSPGDDLTVSAKFKSSGKGSLPFSGSVTLTGTLGSESQHVFASGIISSNGQVTLTAPSFTQGITDLTLTYFGDTSLHTGASRPFTVSDKATTQTTLVGLTNHAAVSEGSTLNLTATTTIVDNSTSLADLTGTFTLMDGNTTVATASTTDGTVVISIDTATIGKHSYTVVYSGDGNNLGSSSSPPINFTVSNKLDTTVTETITGNGSSGILTFGSSLTITATVDAAGAGADIPRTGTVTLKDGDNTVASGTLDTVMVGTVSTSQATFVIAQPTPGTHSYTVVYSGDKNFSQPDPSAATPLTVNAASTTLTLTLPSVTPTTGQSYGLVVQVNSPDAPTVTRTGTVTISENGAPIGTLSLTAATNSSGTLSLSAHSAGTYTYTAAYTSNSTDFSDSTLSTPGTLTITA